MSQLAAGAAARAAVGTSRDRDRMGSDWVPVLAGVPLFTNLSRRHLKRVASLARTRRFHSGSSIVRTGGPRLDVLRPARRDRAGRHPERTATPSQGR
jgi:hypothetical protein